MLHPLTLAIALAARSTSTPAVASTPKGSSRSRGRGAVPPTSDSRPVKAGQKESGNEESGPP